MIPQIKPWIDQGELEQLMRVIDSTYVVEADLTKEFEAEIKKLTGASYAVSMTNGTAALYCCLKSLGIGPGDEVLVPDFTFIATANAVIMAGATPVFCDVLPTTFCLDIREAEKKITAKTKAIMPVHMYGQSADLEPILDFAKQKKLAVIEDAAQGVGVRWNNQHVGTFGDLGILSFYGNKTITCGEGGVVLTESAELAEACYRLKNHGRSKKGVFIHEAIGFNFSFTDLQAAVGIAQLKKLDRIIEKKQSIRDRYVSQLESLAQVFKPVYIDPRCRPVYWFTSFLCADVPALSEFMAKKGIGTRRFFYPLHAQPCYGDLLESSKASYPVTDAIYRDGISLPSSYDLSEADQAHVIGAIREFYANRL